jgi:N utilization substance protein B
MKTSKDPRHIKRAKIMQELFSVEFGKQNQPEREYSVSSQAIIENISKIDSLISEAAPTWPVDKINKIDLAVLRLGIYELFYSREAPTKVVVDEAVELAKEYGSESSGSFVNAVLGKLIDTHPDKIG